MAGTRVPSKDLTFRVAGLPAACDRGTAKVLIEAAACLDPSCSDVKVHSLAASAIYVGEKTATVTSSGLEHALRPPPSADWQHWTLPVPKSLLLAARVSIDSEPDEDEHTISIDTHFEGLTPLSSDGGAEHKFECVCHDHKNS
jgi:hypothetical protein